MQAFHICHHLSPRGRSTKPGTYFNGRKDREKHPLGGHKKCIIIFNGVIEKSFAQQRAIHFMCTMHWPFVTELCFHPCTQFCNIFITPKRTPCPLTVIPQPTRASLRLATTSLFVSTDLPLLDISRKWDYTT